MRIGPFNAWVWRDSSATSHTFKLSISRSQPEFAFLIRGLIARYMLQLIAWMFRDMPGVKGKPGTVKRMIAALAPVFDGEGVTK
ncbi:hypothetical protein [Acetobacter okinawensis]|uniref:hypothetical protein n=1 Tax=Acetobacter okinawensis TaxID=1076594 RepID=UPI0039E9FC9D